MASTLTDFISHIRATGLPTASRYFVEITGASKTTCMMVDQCTLPGLNIMTSEYRTFGEITESAYGITYQPVQLSVILDNKSEAKLFFEDWANQVFDRKTRTVGYSGDYTKDVRIILTDKMDNPIYTVMLHGTYPKNLADIQLDFSNHDIIRLQVTLAFKFWEREEGGLLSPNDVAAAWKNVSFANDMPWRDPMNDPSTPASVTSGFDWTNNTGSSLALFGGVMGSSCAGASSGVARSLTGSSMMGASSLQNNFNSLTGSFTSLGGGITGLGRSLGSVVAPVGVIGGAVGSMSNTLSAINSTLGTLGLGSPFAKVISKLTAVSGTISTVSRLSGLPGSITSIGASMGAMGNQFRSVSNSIKTVPGATTALSNSMNNLGITLEKQGSDMQSGAVNINDLGDFYG